MATDLTKAVQKNAGNDAITKMTFSAWIKRSKLGEATIFTAHQLSSYRTEFYFNGDDALILYSFINSSTSANVVTKRVFRDTNAWYHIMLVVDTTLATTNDRIKFYVNGVRETEMDGSQTHPSQNSSFGQFNDTGATLHIGDTPSRTAFEGVMSHVHYTPYTAYDGSAFGETDATTGEWKIKTSPSVTYSTAGFFILKDGNSVTDQSGNSNNFTVASGDLTKTEDCPSNIYATANPLVRNQVTITTANLTVRSPGSNWMGIPATLGVESGKWYWEYKLALGNAWSQCGVMSSKPSGGYDSIYSTYVGNNSGGLALNSGNGDFYHDGSSGAYGTSAWFSGGLAEYDIIGVALDATNSKIWFAKNGTWGNSSNPSTGSGGIDFSGDTDFTNHKPYLPAFSVHNCILTLNFGNGHLGTAEITTNGGNGFQDTDGNGRFYYAVPTNYRGLSTKGLNA